MKIDMGFFVINPSINVSPYCYSIFRIESYQSCEYECVYCFGRWYRKSTFSEGWHDVVWSFKKLLQYLRGANLKSIPFRLSTLVDPLQPKEEKFRVSRKIMKLCLKHDVPLIINTKSTMLLSGEYLTILQELNSKGLVLVQISLSTVNEVLAKALEPKALSLKARLDVASELAEKGVPVVARLQPFIPGISDCEIEELIERVHDTGVRQVIVESLRDEPARLHLYRELAYEKAMYDSQDIWERYSSCGEPPKVVRPSAQWRREVYLRVKELCDKYEIKFATCKEGMYDYHTAEDCCGMYLLNKEKYVLRPTLFEAWRYYRRRGYLPAFDELLRNLSNNYLFGEALKSYPKPLRKKMASHEKILREVLNKRRSELSRLLPVIVS